MKTEKLTQEIIREIEETQPEKLHIRDRKGTKSTWTTKQTLKTILKTTKEIEQEIKQDKNIQTIKTLTATLAETLLYTVKLTYTKTLEKINKSLTKQLTPQDIAAAEDLNLISFSKVSKVIRPRVSKRGWKIRKYIEEVSKEYLDEYRLALVLKLIDIIKFVKIVASQMFENMLNMLEIYDKVSLFSMHYLSIMRGKVCEDNLRFYITGLLLAESSFSKLFQNEAVIVSTRPELLAETCLLLGEGIEKISNCGLRLCKSGIRGSILINFKLNYEVRDIIDRIFKRDISKENAMFFLAGYISGDGIVEKDGRIRIAISKNCKKFNINYNLLSRACEVLRIELHSVRGNEMECSLKGVDPRIKKYIGNILSIFSLYEYKYSRLLSLKECPHYIKLSENGSKGAVTSSLHVRILNYQFRISHEFHRNNYEIYLRYRCSNVYERDKIANEIEHKLGIKCRKAGGLKYPEVRIGFREILKIIRSKDYESYVKIVKLKTEADRIAKVDRKASEVTILELKSIIFKVMNV